MMFSESSDPRLFGLAPGIDFPSALLAGLRDRMQDRPPEAIARVRILLNTRRMARRLKEMLEAGSPGLLPRIGLVTDLDALMPGFDIPPAVPALRRRLELSQLVSALLDRQPDLAPRTALYDLADSLADLMDEMQGEGVTPELIAALDTGDLSGHWERALTFLKLVQRYFGENPEAPDPEARRRRQVAALISSWRDTPPADPIIVAGSTGSRGTTAMLMEAVARLPQGAIVLPGFDFDMPDRVWAAMGSALTAEDHPQFRFRAFCDRIGVGPAEVRPWTDAVPANPARNRLVSLSLRPAPVTDQWMTEGPRLSDLDSATQGITLLEARSMREEALCIALRLRKAAEDGRTAALITPERMLARQVTAALVPWGIVPDDSAGLPLALSPPGRFLRQVGELLGTPLTPEPLLALLKHPLAHTGIDRGPHLRLTRELELYIRRTGMPFPDGAQLNAFAAQSGDDKAAPWAAWIAETLLPLAGAEVGRMAELVTLHLEAAARMAHGAEGDGAGDLWMQKAGELALQTVEELQQEAIHGGTLPARDYISLFAAVLAQHDVRESDLPHPHVLIWGTLEARVHGADMLILGGLNDGTWPAAPAPDPWLNRALRDQAGLLLPERKIGLSAHDFQQAIAASEVWLTRSVRSDEAETVPSRWISRLTNLLDGLPDQGGPQALAAMRARGATWQRLASDFEAAPDIDRASRPAPRPPVGVRPRQLSVTEIKTLIRDPYAIYARHVLGLKQLDPLTTEADAPLRGTVIHDIMETWVRASLADPAKLTAEALIAEAADTLERDVPWPAVRRLWLARIARVAPRIAAAESVRRRQAMPEAFEVRGRMEFSDAGFVLTAKADRIDRDTAGGLRLLDYKTGQLPTQKAQKAFDKQLLLETLMAEEGAFEGIPPEAVIEAIYVGLGPDPKDMPAPLDEMPRAEIRAEFVKLIRAYQSPDQGYASRRAMEKETDVGRYDSLARFGEWDVTDLPDPETLT